MRMYRIVHKRGYCAVVDSDGRFILSADNEAEAWRELESMEHEWELD